MAAGLGVVNIVLAARLGRKTEMDRWARSDVLPVMSAFLAASSRHIDVTAGMLDPEALGDLTDAYYKLLLLTPTDVAAFASVLFGTHALMSTTIKNETPTASADRMRELLLPWETLRLQNETAFIKAAKKALKIP